jgi:hypothetical protein
MHVKRQAQMNDIAASHAILSLFVTGNFFLTLITFIETHIGQVLRK